MFGVTEQRLKARPRRILLQIVEPFIRWTMHFNAPRVVQIDLGNTQFLMYLELESGWPFLVEPKHWGW